MLMHSTFWAPLLWNTNTNLNVCYRKLGSGTRATTNKTIMVATQGSLTFADTDTGGAAGTATSCFQKNNAGGNVLKTKTFFRRAATGDISTCVGGKQGAVAYIDGDVAQPLTGWYEVPFEGVDPQTNVLKTMVKCGMYRFWGNLTGGDGSRCIPATGSACTSDYVKAHRKGMNTEALYDGSVPALTGPSTNLPAYLPLGVIVNEGLAFPKANSFTDGVFNLKFVAGAQCPARVNAPSGITP